MDRPRKEFRMAGVGGKLSSEGGRFHYAFVASPVKFGTGDFEASPEVSTELGDYRVEPLSDTEIKLSWLPVQRAFPYRVFRDGVKLKDIAAQYPAHYIDEGLDPGQSHEYKEQTHASDSVVHLVVDRPCPKDGFLWTECSLDHSELFILMRDSYGR
jgi:hypothetical protein